VTNGETARPRYRPTGRIYLTGRRRQFSGVFFLRIRRHDVVVVSVDCRVFLLVSFFPVIAAFASDDASDAPSAAFSEVAAAGPLEAQQPLSAAASAGRNCSDGILDAGRRVRRRE